jgi:hypothetical protein
MVCDVNLLLNHQEVFKLIADRGFTIVIPSNGASCRAYRPTISSLMF